MNADARPGSQFVPVRVPAAGFDVLAMRAGDGDVIISLPGSSGIEMSVGKDLLAERYRIVEINPPGWGPSDDVAGTIDQRDLAAILIEAIDRLGIGRFHLLGTSMGAVNALWLAVLYPDRMRSVILEGSIAFMAPPHARRLEHDTFVEKIRSGAVVFDPETMIPPSPPPHPRKPWVDVAHFRAAMTNRFRMFAHYRNDHAAELEARVGELRMPVLVLMGSEDQFLFPSIGEAYAQHMPRAEFVLVPGGTHDLQGGMPEDFAARVEQFVQRAGTP